jgi:hypothetical protein
MHGGGQTPKKDIDVKIEEIECSKGGRDGFSKKFGVLTMVFQKTRSELGGFGNNSECQRRFFKKLEVSVMIFF